MISLSKSRDENGFATSWVLGFAILLLTIGLVFFEIGHVFVEREKLVAAADAAASAGATAVNEDKLISTGKTVELDPDLATQRCLDFFATAKADGGQADSILDKNQSSNNQSICEIGPNNELITATARGTIKFGPIFSFLGISEKELIVRSSAKPSCSDDTSQEGGCK